MTAETKKAVPGVRDMTAQSHPLRLRKLQPGTTFILKRTGDRYLFIRRDYATPGGISYIVQRSGFAKPTTLHHSVHVEIDQ